MADPKSHPESHEHALWVAVSGWAAQTLTLALFSPVVDLTKVGFVVNVVALALATIFFGWGIAGIAAQRGHSRLFAVLAGVNLAGLILVGMLPFIGERDSALSFECPHCKLTTRVDLEHAGREGVCRGCGRAIRVPGLLSASDIADGASNAPRSEANQEKDA